MHRRDWLKGTSAAGLALISSRWISTVSAAADLSALFPGLADLVLTRATELGATFADLHIMQTDRESLFVREEMVQGAWGFAASAEISEKRLLELVESAVAIAGRLRFWKGAKRGEIGRFLHGNASIRLRRTGFRRGHYSVRRGPNPVHSRTHQGRVGGGRWIANSLGIAGIAFTVPA